MSKDLEGRTQKVLLASNRHSWVEASLTDSEMKLVTQCPNEPNIFRSSNLGYLAPEKIQRYLVGELNQIIPGAPELQLYIEFQEDWRHGIAGKYFYCHPVERNGKKDEAFVFDGFIRAGEVTGKVIPPERVTEDNSGLIVPITKGRLDEAIEHQVNYMRNPGTLGVHNPNFETAIKLARVLGTDITERIKPYQEEGIRRRTEWYVTQKLPDVLKSVENAIEFGFDISIPTTDNEAYMQDGRLEGILNFLSDIQEFGHAITDERTIARTNEILETLAKGYEYGVVSEEEKLEKMIKTRKDQIAGLRSQKIEILGLIQKLSPGS